MNHLVPGNVVASLFVSRTVTVRALTVRILLSSCGDI